MALLAQPVVDCRLLQKGFTPCRSLMSITLACGKLLCRLGVLQRLASEQLAGAVCNTWSTAAGPTKSSRALHGISLPNWHSVGAASCMPWCWPIAHLPNLREQDYKTHAPVWEFSAWGRCLICWQTLGVACLRQLAVASCNTHCANRCVSFWAPFQPMSACLSTRSTRSTADLAKCLSDSMGILGKLWHTPASAEL